jgi:Domain of unknown function (DUF4262)
MCWLCDHPHATRRDYLAYFRGLIDRHGWAVQGVQRDKIHPPWAYTVGLTLAGLPELVVTGMPLTAATGLLNDVAHHVLHSTALRPGEQIPLTDGPLIEIVEMSHPELRLATAVEFYGTEIRAVQLVHADGRGHWPWDVGYRGVRGGQPVLGPRTSRPATAA